MARYGLDYYSSKDFPLSYYGPDSPISFVAEDFNAQSVGYGELNLTWITPTGAWAKLKIVKNKYGYPINVNDGQTIFDTTRGNDPQFYIDINKPTEPKVFYYSLFVFETTQLSWVLAGRTTGLSVYNYGTRTRLYDYVPDVMKLVSPYSAGSGTDNKDLKDFLSVFGFKFDYIKSLAQLSKEKYDTEKTVGVLIPPLLSQFGIAYEPEIGFERSRVLLRDVLLIEKTKGSRDGLKSYIKGFTGWGVPQPDATTPNPSTEGITVSHNIMLDYNDSSFEEGVGHWTSPNSSALLSQIAKKEITQLSITSNIARLKIGSHGYGVGQEIFIFNCPYPIFNSTVLTKTITSVDSDSVYFALTAGDLSLRSAYNFSIEEFPYIVPKPEPWVENTTPALFPNKRKGVLAIKNANATNPSEIFISCGDAKPVTLGIPVKTGFQYTFSGYTASSGTGRSVQAAIKWYDRFGVLMSTTTGTGVTNSTGSFSARPFVTDRAPTRLFLNAITKPGSGYANGSYTNVPLVYVSGKQPTITPLASIFVDGGVVASISVTNGGAGADTTTIFTVSNTSLGGTGSGFEITVQRCQECYYAVPQFIISSVAPGNDNEYHYFDACQFEQDTSATSYDDARTVHLTLKANRINELLNPRFESPTTPWSTTNATSTVVSGSAEPNIDFYQITSKSVTGGVATLTTSVVHTFKSGDVVVIENMGSPFDGTKTLNSAGDNVLSFAVTGGNVSATTATGQIYKSGNALRVTASGTTQVLVKSTTTSADLTNIHYPGTAYTFSVYAKAGQAGVSVTSSIVWYNSSKSVISTATGSNVAASVTGWVRPSVTAIAPANAAYAHVQLAWEPAAPSHFIFTDAALFENSFFVLDYFDGSTGFSSTAELFWEGSTPNAGRSHYYKNRVAIEKRLNAGALDEYVGLGASYAVYLAQPKT